MGRRSNKRSREGQDRTDRPVGGVLYRALLTVLILLVVLYVAVLVLSRTAGFRSLVEERIRTRWDWPVALESVWITPALNVEARGIRSVAEEEGVQPSFKIDRMAWVWTWKRLLHPERATVQRTRMEGARWVFQEDEEGVVQPAYLAAVARALAGYVGFASDLEEGALVLDGLAGDWVWDAVDVYWLDRAGHGQGVLQGVDYVSAEVAVPGHGLRTHRLRVRTVIRPDGRTDHDVATEWFRMDRRYSWVLDDLE